MARWLTLTLLLIAAGCGRNVRSLAAETTPPAPAEVLFAEPFEDTNWQARGWYDDPRMELTAAEHAPGSSHACRWHWAKAGDIGITGRGGRVHFRPVTNLTLSFALKHSANWTWTGVPWHPHELLFMTDVDPAYLGPAETHLTIYVEAVNGKPRVAIQDSLNIVAAQVGHDLVGVTEQRAVAGGNGASDGYGPGDCYRFGDHYRNGKYWEPRDVYFSDQPGPRYQGDWHRIKVKLALNTVRDGVGQKDGIIQYWYDGKLIMDYHDIVFRTGQHPTMRLNQFLMLPYYGPGVPHEQTIWIDDLKITTP